MKPLVRNALVLVLLLALAILSYGCSDDDTPTNGSNPDTAAPEVVNVAGLNFQNVQLEFDEKVDKATAERADNYLIVQPAPRIESDDPAESQAAPGDTIHTGTVALLAGGKQVLITTWDWMSNVEYDITVTGIKDVNGNQMTGASTNRFTGFTGPDEIDPEIISRTPADGATGVGTAQSVIVQFSEPMDGSTVYEAFSWTAGMSAIPFAIDARGNEFAFTPLLTLQTNTDYNITISSAAKDWAGNSLTPTNWSFRTTSSPDLTPPALESSTPANGDVNVSTDSYLKLTFSETIDPLSINDDAILVTPDLGPGTPYWSNQGKTLTFEPDNPLAEDTQYILLIPQGAIRDLAGNTNEESITIQFATGAFFAGGGFNGRVEGDDFSADAKDPVGAVVLAPDRPIFVDGDGMQIFGTGVVGTDSAYAIDRLPDGWYYPFAILDSNGDGLLEPDLGDAIGVYGVDIRMMDIEYDSVQVDNGNTVTGIDIKLFDPMVIAGKSVYIGDAFTPQLFEYYYNVGLFDTTGFDVANPDWSSPDFNVMNRSIVYQPDWSIDQLESFPPLSAGTYWVAAYLEVGDNQNYDPDMDPAGVYCIHSTGEWIPVTIADGTDGLDVYIYLEDPELGGTLSAPASAWRGTDVADAPESVKRMRQIRSWMRSVRDTQRGTR